MIEREALPPELTHPVRPAAKAPRAPLARLAARRPRWPERLRPRAPDGLSSRLLLLTAVFT
ncbi:hypothetical protein ABFV89_16480, partial [Brucella abortus]|uniref:hypothetical protein n=1 Tax=Brucella abortus TaxID=235 RepID=UPI003218C5A0